MISKEELKQMFDISLAKADISKLDRGTDYHITKQFDGKISTGLTSYKKFLDNRGKIRFSFSPSPGYSIKLENKSDIIHISKVTVEFYVFWNDWKLKDNAWFKIFSHKKIKSQEIQNYMKQFDLNDTTEVWNGCMSGNWREKFNQRKEYYAIFYGNYIKEITIGEYENMCQKYLDRIKEIDELKINQIIEK